MNIPAQAFGQLYPQDLAPGMLFRFRGGWALRISREPDFQAFLVLEGERVGEAFKLGPGMAKAVAIVQPFGWFPMVDLAAKPTLEGDRAAALALGEHGPFIIAEYAQNGWNPTYLAFDLEGKCLGEQDMHTAMRLRQWSVELCHKDRPYESLGTLVQIDPQ